MCFFCIVIGIAADSPSGTPCRVYKNNKIAMFNLSPLVLGTFVDAWDPCFFLLELKLFSLTTTGTVFLGLTSFIV